MNKNEDLAQKPHNYHDITVHFGKPCLTSVRGFVANTKNRKIRFSV